MIDKILIEKKIQQVIEYLDELRPIADRMPVARGSINYYVGYNTKNV